jgi:dihydropteroate synthase
VILSAGGQRWVLERPWLMGVVNVTPDSFSDRDGEDPVERARELLREGADIIDIGGESGITGVEPVGSEEEIARVVPVVAQIAGELGARVSVDTYKPEVAAAAIDAGAAMVNDPSGLSDPALADLCGRTGAALVLAHTYAEPKQKVLDPVFDETAQDDVAAFLAEAMRDAQARGVAPEQVVLDPGPDLGKTPHQTVGVLRALDRVTALGRPVLLAVSRKDFIGAATGRRPRERGAGTLAALGEGFDRGAAIARVHDVAAARDFLRVRALLRGEAELPSEARLDLSLRRERG